MNIGAEAGVSGNAVKNLLTTLDASIVMKDVKNSTKSLVSQMDKEEIFYVENLDVGSWGVKNDV